MNKSRVAVIFLSILLVLTTALAVNFYLGRNAERAQRVWFEDQLERITRAKEVLERDRDELIEAKAVLDEQVEELASEAETLADRLAQERRARQVLTAELAQVRRGADDIEGELETWREETSNLTGELANAKRSYRALSNELTTLRQAKEALERRVKEMLAARAREAERIIVRRPRDLKLPQEKSGLEGRVLVVNREFNFVVVSLGSKDGIRTGSQFSVLRKGRTVGTVEVERLYENMAAANVLQEEKRRAIQEGDTVELVS